MPVNEDDIFTRFIFGKWKIRKSENQSGVSEIRIHPAAFQPHEQRNDLSVSQISDLKLNADERSIWFIGKWIEKKRQDNGSPSNLYGRGDLSVSQIHGLNLGIHPDESPPRHANLINFPPFSTEKESVSFYIQQMLSNIAEGFLSKDEQPEISNILNEDVAVKPEFSGH
jgi:hypothetical protein